MNSAVFCRTNGTVSSNEMEIAKNNNKTFGEIHFLKSLFDNATNYYATFAAYAMSPLTVTITLCECSLTFSTSSIIVCLSFIVDEKLLSSTIFKVKFFLRIMRHKLQNICVKSSEYVCISEKMLPSSTLNSY